MEKVNKDFEKKLKSDDSFLDEGKSFTEKIKKRMNERSDLSNSRETKRRKIIDADEPDEEEKRSSWFSSGMVGAFISILVATMVGVGVAIPVIQDTIGNITTNTTMTGAAGTILNILPLMIGIVLFVAVAALISTRSY